VHELPAKSAGRLLSRIVRISDLPRREHKKVLPEQPERHITKSRINWFNKRRRHFLIWKTYASRMKQLALSGRVHSTVPAILMPVWENRRRYEIVEFAPEASNEVFLPYKTHTRGATAPNFNTILGIQHD